MPKPILKTPHAVCFEVSHENGGHKVFIDEEMTVKDAANQLKKLADIIKSMDVDCHLKLTRSAVL